MESTYLQGLLNGPQLNSDGIDKFTKAHKIDPYYSSIRQGVKVKIPSIQEI